MVKCLTLTWWLVGHSLGGAVALLCTLDLLHSLGEEANPNLACVGFATPAVGNAALADYIKQKGWHHYITNYLVPGQRPCGHAPYPCHNVQRENAKQWICMSGRC